jgi:hypothetical protein
MCISKKGGKNVPNFLKEDVSDFQPKKVISNPVYDDSALRIDW